MEESGRKRSYVWFWKCNSMWIAFDFKREREKEKKTQVTTFTHTQISLRLQVFRHLFQQTFRIKPVELYFQRKLIFRSFILNFNFQSLYGYEKLEFHSCLLVGCRWMVFFISLSHTHSH